MARQSSAICGSGTIPFVASILTPESRGTAEDGRGERYGSNVVIINAEDLNSVDYFASSGVTVGTIPVMLSGPGLNPPRIRSVTIQNTSSTTELLIANSQDVDFLNEGYSLSRTGATVPYDRLTLPVLENVEIWARALAGTVDVRMVCY